MRGESRLDVTGELATVGTAGASALVTAMTTDGWNSVRAWIGRWLGRGHDEIETHQLALLDRDHDRLMATPEDQAQDQTQAIAAAWAVRLQDAADIDQASAQELLDWVHRWLTENPHQSQSFRQIRQSAKASGHARITQVGGNQTINRSDKS